MKYLILIAALHLPLSCQTPGRLSSDVNSAKESRNDDLSVSIKIRGDSNRVTVIQYLPRAGKIDTVVLDTIKQ